MAFGCSLTPSGAEEGVDGSEGPQGEEEIHEH